MCINNQDDVKYGSWDMKCNKHNFFVILDKLLPFYLPNSLENKNMKKKNPGNIIILHKCTKNHDLMLYCSWDMVCAGCNCYFSFWAIFSIKWKKKHLEISLNTSVPKIMIIYFIVPAIWYVPDVIAIFHFGLFFALLLP